MKIDLTACELLLQIRELLEHNDFLTAQSQKIREFYIHMAKEYPLLAFNFKGRIKSLIRAEAKFNGYIVEYIYDYYMENKAYPSISELKQRLSCFRDLIAYRIVTSLPKCYLKPDESQEEADLRYLYQIANELPGFLEERGFTAELAYGVKKSTSPLLNDDVKPYYRDYYLVEILLRLPVTPHHLLRQQLPQLYGSPAPHQAHGRYCGDRCRQPLKLREAPGGRARPPRRDPCGRMRLL